CKTNPKVYNNYASLLLEKGITKGVLPLLKQSMKFGKYDYDSVQNLGLYYALIGDYSNSLKYFELAAKKDNPKLFSVYLNMVVIYLQKNDKVRAKYYLQEAAKLGNSKKLLSLQKMLE
ncbi:MAG: hypothetical protein GXO49_06905, partial [Chlorobi bacterium]|nr:hypothetical protein [Chlorobiota bacterium]